MLVGLGCLGVFKGRCRVSCSCRWKHLRTPTKQKVVAHPTSGEMVNNTECFYPTQKQVLENSNGLCSHFCLYFSDFHLMCMRSLINISRSQLHESRVCSRKVVLMKHRNSLAFVCLLSIFFSRTVPTSTSCALQLWCAFLQAEKGGTGVFCPDFKCLEYI